MRKICPQLKMCNTVLTQHNDRRGAVPNLLILCPGNLYHRLGGRVLHHDLETNHSALD